MGEKQCCQIRRLSNVDIDIAKNSSSAVSQSDKKRKNITLYNDQSELLRTYACFHVFTSRLQQHSNNIVSKCWVYSLTVHLVLPSPVMAQVTWLTLNRFSLFGIDGREERSLSFFWHHAISNNNTELFFRTSTVNNAGDDLQFKIK